MKRQLTFILAMALLFVVTSSAWAGYIVEWGTYQVYSGPTNVPAGNDFVDIAGGFRHNLALRSDGSLVAWGENNYGQCDVPTGNDFVDIAAGLSWSLA